MHPSPRPSLQSENISLHNLDGEVEDAQRRMQRGEALAAHRLPGLLVERAGYLGTVDDYDEADTVSARNVEADPDDGAVRLARAHVLAALHRFDDATRELDAAAAHGASHDDVARARATILLATGRCAEAAPLWPERAYPTDLATRGAIEQRLGHPGASDALFERARLEFRDVSPLTFAWIDFERARAHEREGDNAGARAYLEDALEVFPHYAHAAVHLSVLESAERALQYLTPVEERATDPDVLAAHADALRRLKRDGEARAMLKRAKSRYEELLVKHPEAFGDHAARFFLGGGGDVRRALDLAKAAAAHAPTEETLELWVLAARAAGSNDEACAAVAAASKTTCPLRASRATFESVRCK